MEQRGRKQKVKKRSHWLLTIGKSGIIQSLLIHIFLLLFLALSFTVVHKHHIVKLCINFEPEESSVSIEPIAIEIPQPEVSENYEDIQSDILLVEDIPIQVNILDFQENKPSVPTENITAEVVNATVSDTDTAYRTPRASSTVNKSSGSSASLDRFNAMMHGKLDDRLAKHGAHSGDIQVSISWDDYNDIDLWVEFQPFNFRNQKHFIGWTNRESINGGYLDIDMNVEPFTNEAVENIVWPKNRSPYGTYTVYAHYYHQWDRNHTTQVYLRVQADDKVTYRKSIVTFGHGPQKLYTFTRRPTKK